ncbi:hypothetical protein B0H17DRAFT_1148340 [Mycena rosella]|uniref:Uncharacterized protein n=1 Tax=Mycena rosella TaxID=1033263 RepID=A0AAD7CDJ1_MYCRO|nr:hypothetical protein B0H17DRAFT_1148340 [Mycena rosella]
MYQELNSDPRRNPELMVSAKLFGMKPSKYLDLFVLSRFRLGVRKEGKLLFGSYLFRADGHMATQGSGKVGAAVWQLVWRGLSSELAAVQLSDQGISSADLAIFVVWNRLAEAYRQTSPDLASAPRGFGYRPAECKGTTSVFEDMAFNFEARMSIFEGVFPSVERFLEMADWNRVKKVECAVEGANRPPAVEHTQMTKLPVNSGRRKFRVAADLPPSPCRPTLLTLRQSKTHALGHVSSPCTHVHSSHLSALGSHYIQGTFMYKPHIHGHHPSCDDFPEWPCIPEAQLPEPWSCDWSRYAGQFDWYDTEPDNEGHRVDTMCSYGPALVGGCQHLLSLVERDPKHGKGIWGYQKFIASGWGVRFAGADDAEAQRDHYQYPTEMDSQNLLDGEK